jgi:5-methylcytosine-specific restriction endonuclease McrA
MAGHSRRRFSRRERAALLLAADGCCSQCGAVLGAEWHADHVVAYVHGGETDVTNGQSLCARCNLMKGPHDAKTTTSLADRYPPA